MFNKMFRFILFKVEGPYSRFDHVPTACSYPNVTQKIIYYFLYLYLYLFNDITGFPYLVKKAYLSNDLSTRNIVL